jgi:hypothetical protein
MNWLARDSGLIILSFACERVSRAQRAIRIDLVYATII